MPGEDLASASLERYLGIWTHQEMRAVYIFLENADKIGIATPIDYAMLRTAFEKYFSDPDDISKGLLRRRIPT